MVQKLPLEKRECDVRKTSVTQHSCAYAKGGKVLPFPPQAFLLALLNIDDRTALVLTAVLASTVRHAELAAVGALDDSGSGELPGRRTSLVTSLSRYFSFWDCHVDTS